jgi:hypothetical protein
MTDAWSPAASLSQFTKSGRTNPKLPKLPKPPMLPRAGRMLSKLPMLPKLRMLPMPMPMLLMTSTLGKAVASTLNSCRYLILRLCRPQCGNATHSRGTLPNPSRGYAAVRDSDDALGPRCLDLTRDVRQVQTNGVWPQGMAPYCTCSRG